MKLAPAQEMFQNFATATDIKKARWKEIHRASRGYRTGLLVLSSVFLRQEEEIVLILSHCRMAFVAELH